jgi:membrane associated rhomboid family serine protease
MKQEKSFRQFMAAVTVPLIFVAILWLIKIVEVTLNSDFSDWGVFPQTLKGLRGILFSPLLHGGWSHLSSNSIPLILLGFGLFNFYRSKSWVVLGFIYLFSGVLTWIIGRESYHIGASGLVYGIAFFLLVSSLIRKETGLSAFSMLIIFLYGSIVWGFFPQFFPHENISWEAHLSGAISGVIMAIYFRNEGPQRKKYFEEEEENIPEEEQYWNISQQKSDTEVSPD